MAITKAKKEEILARIGSIKDEAKSLVFVGFNGVSVSDISAMRAKFREEGVGYFVAKKSLIRRALESTYKGELPTLDGEVALAWSDDDIAPAQNIRAFEKEYKDKITILGGVFEGEYKDKATMTEIGSIPALPVLRGMFVNVINSPIQGLVVALNGIAEKRA